MTKLRNCADLRRCAGGWSILRAELLGPGTPDEWQYRRDPRIRMPMAEALWERDGIRYLQPEIQLLYKARGLREKDLADFDATLPFLDGRRRVWLTDALAQTIPGHPWTAKLD